MLKHALMLGTLSLALLTPALAASLPARQVVASGSHCVAWRTTKTLALVSQQEVVGNNCQITVKAQKNAAGKFFATVSVPIAGFNSKEPDRDKEVLKILKANVQPNVLFTTAPLTLAEWKTMLAKGGGLVRGTLAVGGRSFPMTANAKVRQSGGQIEVSGNIVTRFTNLGIQPPEVGPGGAIAKVPDYLELHYNLLSSKVQNIGIVK
ncbi:MAG: YceI family protein [Candidatus Sericytochromatia bacterium]